MQKTGFRTSMPRRVERHARNGLTRKHKCIDVAVQCPHQSRLKRLAEQVKKSDFRRDQVGESRFEPIDAHW
jgi:hypothetical protein